MRESRTSLVYTSSKETFHLKYQPYVLFILSWFVSEDSGISLVPVRSNIES